MIVQILRSCGMLTEGPTYKQTQYLPKQINKMYVLLSVAQKSLNYQYFCFSFKTFVTPFFTLAHAL